VDPEAYRPVHTTVAILAAARAVAPEHFAWRAPPYEYETVKPPIDILWGHDGLRLGVDAGQHPDRILVGTADEIAAFEASVAPDLLYG
jgi:hypothetical protein